MKERQLSDFITAVRELSSGTEAPDHFWVWSAIYTINAALERKVWLDFGMDRILPNLYIILSSPPGKCRKGGPIALSKRLLKAIKVNVSRDSTSKQALTMELADAVKTVTVNGKPFQHSPIAILSKEFSSLLAVDPKAMIEFLTDGFDYHEDTWEYNTKHGREDKIYGPCISLFAATTPTYVANNIPYEAFGGGFFSRVVFVVGKEKKQRISLPQMSEEQRGLLEQLARDLHTISFLSGKFFWENAAFELYDTWYNGLDRFYEVVTDERFHGYLERMHIHALKVAMALSVSTSNNLVINEDHMRVAINLIEDRVSELPDAFGGLGRSDQSVNLHMLIEQISVVGQIKSSELLRQNWRNMNQMEFDMAIDALYKMDYISMGSSMQADGRPDKIIKWKGGNKGAPKRTKSN